MLRALFFVFFDVCVIAKLSKYSTTYIEPELINLRILSVVRLCHIYLSYLINVLCKYGDGLCGQSQRSARNCSPYCSFQTTHIEPDKEDLHIPIQGDNTALIIINIEEHFSMSTALVSGIFNNDLSRCPQLLLLLTDISQELRTHLTGGI
jgi:hypothetical protein